MTPLKHTILEESGDFIVYDEALTRNPGVRLFDPEWWGEKATSHTEGRGTVWFLESGDDHWILKTFQRGGLIARFIKRHYFFCGHSRSRMVHEYHLLSHLHQMGLPVPRPVAAYSRRSTWLGYSGSLITQRLSEVESLASRLSAAQTLGVRRWQEIGRTIRRFHDCDVFHSDLNASNVLLGEHGVYLIDFDRGRIRSDSFLGNWRRANLKRLRRSLDKLSMGATFDRAQAWAALVEGYDNPSVT